MTRNELDVLLVGGSRQGWWRLAQHLERTGMPLLVRSHGRKYSRPSRSAPVPLDPQRTPGDGGK